MIAQLIVSQLCFYNNKDSKFGHVVAIDSIMRTFLETNENEVALKHLCGYLYDFLCDTGELPVSAVGFICACRQ